MQHMEIGGQEIAVLESHGGGRPVIFVHGNSAAARTWRPLIDGLFGRRFRCLAFSLPGHGGSPPASDPASYSLPGYAAILAGVAEATGADNAVVVGWSLGGHIALEAAPLLPARPASRYSAHRPSRQPIRWAQRSCPTRP